MALWSNIDSNTGAPKYAVAGGTGISASGQILYANTTFDVYETGAAIGVFGVAADEKTGNTPGNVSVVTVTSSGDSAFGLPAITITGANTTQATATLNAAITGVTIVTAGTGYGNGNVFYAHVGANTTRGVLTVTNVNSNGNILAVSITTSGRYSTITSSNNITFTANAANINTTTVSAGSGFTANLRFGIESVTVSTVGAGYRKGTVGATASANGIANAAFTISLTGQEGTERGPLAGWNLRKEGSGGRAGRVHYECLVAMGSISGGTDSDDAQLSE
jgi:hypothetical protein